MPVIALVGLILSAIKVAIDLAAFLKDHPDIPFALQQVLQGAAARLEETHTDLATPYDRHHVEAP